MLYADSVYVHGMMAYKHTIYINRINRKFAFQLFRHSISIQLRSELEQSNLIA